MKKILFLSIILLFVLVGCSNGDNSFEEVEKVEVSEEQGDHSESETTEGVEVSEVNGYPSESEDSKDEKIKAFLEVITVFVAVVNVFFVILVYNLHRKDSNPRLYVTSKITNASNRYDKSVNKDVDNINFKQKGFPEKHHDTMLWELLITNNGDFPATNIIAEYEIVIKKAEFEFGIDKADTINERFEDYKIINKLIKIDYIPPNTDKSHKVLFLTGKFPYADLNILNLKSSERNFLKKPILLETYKHPGFSSIEDGHQFRQMIGAYWE